MLRPKEPPTTKGWKKWDGWHDNYEHFKDWKLDKWNSSGALPTTDKGSAAVRYPLPTKVVPVQFHSEKNVSIVDEKPTQPRKLLWPKLSSLQKTTSPQESKKFVPAHVAREGKKADASNKKRMWESQDGNVATGEKNPNMINTDYAIKNTS